MVFMKKLTKLSTTLLLLFFTLTGTAIAKQNFNNEDFAKGEVCGRLLKSALIVDAYYEFCFPSDNRTGSYTAGAIKLAKDKFDFDMLAWLNDSEKTIGRNIAKEAFMEVEKDLALIGGCDSASIQDWKVLAYEQYDKYLQQFHKYGQ